MIENALQRTIGKSRRDAPRFPDVNYVGKAVRDGRSLVHPRLGHVRMLTGLELTEGYAAFVDASCCASRVVLFPVRNRFNRGVRASLGAPYPRRRSALESAH